MHSTSSKTIAAIIDQALNDILRISEVNESKIRTRSKLSDDLEGVLVDRPDLSANSWIHYAQNRLPASWECLDFGCGNAPHRAFLENAGAIWTGCDYDASSDPATLARGGRISEVR